MVDGGYDIMPLLVAQRSLHGVAALDHQLQLQKIKTGKIIKTSASTPTGSVNEQQPLDFTMSKFKTTTSSRHSALYRKFYKPDDSPPYNNINEEQGKLMILEIVSFLSYRSLFTLLLLILYLCFFHWFSFSATPHSHSVSSSLVLPLPLIFSAAHRTPAATINWS